MKYVAAPVKNTMRNPDVRAIITTRIGASTVLCKYGDVVRDMAEKLQCFP